MSLTVDGFWKAGFWSTTFWADGFWYEGAPVPPPAATTSGGGGRKRKYPRRVMAYGKLYTVRNPDEERQLLQALVDRAKTLAAISPEPDEVAAVRRRIRTIERRVKAVDDSEAQWLRRLREIDEELLLLL